MYGEDHFPSRPPRICVDPLDLARETSDCAFADDTDRRAAFALWVPKDERSNFPWN